MAEGRIVDRLRGSRAGEALDLRRRVRRLEPGSNAVTDVENAFRRAWTVVSAVFKRSASAVNRPRIVTRADR